MAPICQYIVVHLNNPLTSLEMVSKLSIATNNTASKLIGYIVAYQVITHKIRFDKETFLADLTFTRANSQFSHL